MKKLLLFVFISFSFFACDASGDDQLNATNHNYALTVIGTCPFISIDGDIYHGLNSATDYIDEGIIPIADGGQYTFRHVIEKHTGDATTVTATLEVDGAIAVTDTTSAAYGVIVISHTIN